MLSHESGAHGYVPILFNVEQVFLFPYMGERFYPMYEQPDREFATTKLVIAVIGIIFICCGFGYMVLDFLMTIPGVA